MGFRANRKNEIDLAVRAALAEFAASLEVRLHTELTRSRETQLTLIEAVAALRTDAHYRDGELADVIEGVARAIERATESAELDRTERRALVDSVLSAHRAVIDARSVPPIASNGERVIGGTIGPVTPRGVEDFDEIVLDDVELHQLGDPAQSDATEPHRIPVDCLVDGQWRSGFEVVAIARGNGATRYQVARTADGSLFEYLFDGHQLRCAPSESTAISFGPHGAWSRV